MRFLLFFVTGLLLSYYLSDYQILILLISFLVPCLLIIHIFFLQNRSLRLKNLRGLGIFLFMAIAGALLQNLHSHHTKLPANQVHYRGIISGKAILKGNYYQTDCQVFERIAGDSLRHLKEKIRLYIEYDPQTDLPEIGDRIIFTTRLQRIKNRGNPGEFDYAGFMKNEGILYSAYLREQDFIFQGNSGKKPLARFASCIQSKLVKAFSSAGIEDEELGVISALIAGDRQYLTPEVRSDFIDAGAMHVLAVSGLHVGILYLFLGLLLGSRNNRPAYRIFRLLFMLVALWLFVFITGMSTSVLRAAIMFSFFLAGKSFNRTAGSFNLLAASALFILALDPSALFRAGFQYSYLAVLGILYFQPRIERQLNFRNFVAGRIWQLLSVSLSAQLTTFPLGLFYFHQFPSYFLLTNLVIIPMVWLIMMAAILFFLASPLPLLLKVAAWFLNQLIHLTNLAVKFISHLPGSSLKNIRFEEYHLALTCLLLLLSTYFLMRKKRQVIPIILAGYTIILLGAGMLTYPRTPAKPIFIIYNLKNQHVISYINGSQHILFTLAEDPEALQTHLKYLEPFWISRQLYGTMQKVNLNKFHGKLLMMGNLQIVIDSTSWVICSDGVCLNYGFGTRDVFRPEQRYYKLVDALSDFPANDAPVPDYIIVTSALPTRVHKFWLEYAESHTIPIHDMNMSGACFVGLQPRINEN